MPRIRADDYDEKRQEILDAAASVFARIGYANTTMADIARVCGTSKSMLYHYFPRKEGVLFEMMIEHVETLLESAEEVARAPSPPEQRLGEFVHLWVRNSVEARTRHAVLMYDLKFLPRREQKPIIEVERRLIDLLAGIVAEANPGVRRGGLARTYARLLFGMLNWTDVWYRSTGPLSPGAMSELVVRTFTQGLVAAR